MINSLPTTRQLGRGLSDVFGEDVSIEDRTHSAYSSTFPIERVVVNTTAERIAIVCKYGQSRTDSFTGHRRGTYYEAEVYERVLAAAAFKTPAYLGNFMLGPDQCCLVSRFVDGYRVSSTPDPGSLVTTCRALAESHRRTVVDGRFDLNRFDHDYFTNWARGIGSLNPPGPIAQDAVKRMSEVLASVVDSLCQADTGLVHGELYPDNVIISAAGPVFLDWETAGVGVGLLDLATLIDGNWDPHLVSHSVAAYLEVYPAGIRTQLARTLEAARVYASAQTLRFEAQSETLESAALLRIESAANALNSRIAAFG